MRASWLVFLVAVALTGCSLVNPYVIDQRVREGRDARGERLVVNPSRMTLPEASQYAARVKQRYRDALGDQAQLNSWLGIGLIPLSAAAMGVGATGGPASAVLATGLTGAAGLGVGVWLSNRSRDAAYVAGIKAVTCAETAVTPLALSDQELSQFASDLATLGPLIPPVEREIAAVSKLADELAVLLNDVPAEVGKPYASILAEARAEIAAAKSLVESAGRAFETGTELRQVMFGLGRRLALAIDKIVDTVDGIIADTQRDPQALSAIIGSLGGTYKMLTTVPDALKPRAVPPATPSLRPEAGEALRALGARRQVEIVTAAQNLIAQVASLRNREAALSNALRPVAAVINAVSKDAPLRALEGCGVNAADIVTALAIDPSPPLAVTKPGSVGFVARGGVSPYGASIKGPGDRVSVTPAGPFSPAFTVTAASDATDGTYTVTVFDGSKQLRTFEVAVGAAPAKEKPAPTTDGGSGEDTGSTKDALAKFIEKTRNQSIEVPGTGVTLEVGEPEVKDGKVAVPATAEVTGEVQLDALTEKAIKTALQKNAVGSGILPADIAVDVAALRKQVEATVPQAPRAAVDCGRIALETPVPSDSEPAFSRLPEHRRRQLQAALCLPERPTGRGDGIDGLWGPRTRQALKQYQCRTGRPVDGKLTASLLAELLARTDAEVMAQCAAR